MDLVYSSYYYRCWSKILLNPIHTPGHGEGHGVKIFVKVLRLKFLRPLNF